jgi:hypothetical protein
MTISLHVDEIVLHGFPPVDRYRIAESVQTELARLLVEQGVPASLEQGGSIARLDVGAFDLAPDARSDRIGVQVAQAIYGGLLSGQTSTTNRRTAVDATASAP